MALAIRVTLWRGIKCRHMLLDLFEVGLGQFVTNVIAIGMVAGIIMLYGIRQLDRMRWMGAHFYL